MTLTPLSQNLTWLAANIQPHDLILSTSSESTNSFKVYFLICHSCEVQHTL